MKNRKKYVFIIVDFFSAEETFKYVNHIHNKIAHLKSDIAFVVVDNSNDKENLDKLKKYILRDDYDIHKETIFTGLYNGYQVAIISASANLGYAKGNNYGIEIANLLFIPEYIIISNNDIVCLDETLKLEKMDQLCKQDATIAIVGPCIIGEYGEKQSPCKEMNIYTRWIRMGLFYPFNHLFGFSSDDLIREAKAGYVYRVIGAFLFIRSDYLNEVGGFDGKTFLYAEESILAERMQQINKKVYYYPEINLLHHHSAVIGKKYESFKRTELMFKSELYYFKKYKNVSKLSLHLARFAFSIFKMKYVVLAFLRLQK